MATGNQNIAYRRKGTQGTLRLKGVVDIFEASTLLATAQRALRDSQAKSLTLDMSEVERLDLSAVQILLTLKRDFTAQGHTFDTTGSTESVTRTLSLLGVNL